MNSDGITKLPYLDGHGQTSRSILRLMKQVAQRRNLLSSTV